MQDLRLQRLKDWLAKQFDTKDIHITPLEGDAGFRRYYRTTVKRKSYIAVDAPTATCNNQAFIDIAGRLSNAGVKVPYVHFSDLINGWLCLEDFGNQLLIQSLSEESFDAIYKRAMKPLLMFTNVDSRSLPVFDGAFIRLELNIFSQWLLEQHLSIALSSSQQANWANCQTLLVGSALEQPQQFMHRDYHSRNIMRCTDDALGIIDFQDAVNGPITYDIVSLLKDCYIKWPREKILGLYQYYLAQLDSELVKSHSRQQWIKWFDLMGMQRHLKASGIFARLHHRDGKSHYLHDIPLTLSYVIETAMLYPEFAFLVELIESEVIPKLEKITEINQ